MRCREEEGPGSPIEEFDERPRSGDVPAERSQRFRERTDLDVNATVESEVIDGAASVRTEHAAGVCVVHHHDAAELVCYVTKTGQRAQVAVHAEHAVGDEQR